MKTKVYLAAPYSKPDPCVNTNIAMKVANNLMNMGYAPYIPHLTHFQHTYHPRPSQDWYDLDNEFLRSCDVVWRLPGESRGADNEVNLAKELGIPVVYSLTELKKIKERRIK